MFLVTALTAAGRIPIGGIQFDVETTFPGIDGFSHEATIPAVPVVIGGGGAGGSEYLAYVFPLAFILLTVSDLKHVWL